MKTAPPDVRSERVIALLEERALAVEAAVAKLLTVLHEVQEAESDDR